jgi:single-strand DNA-binding protein
MADLNSVTVTGRVTMDPELRETRTGTPLVNLRVVVNDAVRNSETGEWDQKANFINVTVFGPSAENLAKSLTKGSRIAVDGRLSWREWTTDAGVRGQALDVVAQNVHYLDTKAESEARRDRNGAEPVAVGAAAASAPAEDDSIPF